MTVVGANTKTSVYEQETGDPRSTQSELLTGVGAQPLTYYSPDGTPTFKYARRHAVERTERPVHEMPEGSYRVDEANSAGGRFVITYRPTQEDILLDAAERAQSAPAPAEPTPAPAAAAATPARVVAEMKAPAKRANDELQPPEPLTTGLPPIPATVGTPGPNDEPPGNAAAPPRMTELASKERSLRYLRVN